VRGDLSDRRYSDEELRRIIEDAALSEARGETVARSQSGHTLADIREIAKEFGIDPAAIERAAANLIASQQPAGAARGWLDFPRVIHEETVIPRPLTNDEMRRLTIQAERVVGRRGSIRETGNWVEWRDPQNRVYVGIVRGHEQTRVRAIADHSRELMAGAFVLGGLGIGSLQLVAGAGTLATAVAGVAIIASATFGLIRLHWKWWTDNGRGHLQELLQILEDTARDV
jgi:hypothetical protein